jgi:fused signal recognition particle receptor
MLKEIIFEILDGNNSIDVSQSPTVMLVIGVNGVGKTTSIGKLAAKYKKEGKQVVLGAADTFRAAAIEQLEIWSQRAGVTMVKSVEGTDPASVVFDTLASAKAKGADVVICDTAGRLHNKKNLMDELAKINRVVDRSLESGRKETLLVLDAATGQNAVNQARQFSEVTDITGIILTKLDGTAHGGVVISIMDELKIPVKFIGVGEQIDDLMPFDAKEFAEGLFGEE